MRGRMVEQGQEVTILSPAETRWTLGLLLVANAFNFMDRQLFAVLQSDVQRELGLTDFQLGIIHGPTFAIFFAVMGLPIARLVERYSRTWILSLSIGLWSLFAMLCGTATSFVPMALYRIGLGVGEAGCTPTAHSLIGDYFPPSRRTRAISIYTAGLCVGTFFGALLSGSIAQMWGWRAAFIIIGLPGVLLAIVLKIKMREPKRGQAEPPGSRYFDKGDVAPSFATVLLYIRRRSTVAWLIFAQTFAAFSFYGVNAFTPSYFVRAFELSISQVGLITAVAGGLFGGAGTLLGGWLADRYSARGPQSYCLVPIIALTLAVPCVLGIFLAPSWPIAALCFMLSQMLFWAYISPTYGLLNLLMEPRMRATAAALSLLISGVLGYGLGPLFVGAASDSIASHAFGQAGYLELCASVERSVSVREACAAASITGLRWSLAICGGVTLFILTGMLAALRTVKRDLDA